MMVMSRQDTVSGFFVAVQSHTLSAMPDVHPASSEGRLCLWRDWMNVGHCRCIVKEVA